MTYFQDLTCCDYHSGPFDTKNWRCPLLAVGWLEYPKRYSRGVVDNHVLDKLKLLSDHFKFAFPQYLFRGLHKCSLCGDGEDLWLDNSHVNIFVPGKDVVYIAPGRIDHYIRVHNYCPPEDFINAVNLCPDPTSLKFSERLRQANRGEDCPLYS